MVFKKIFITLLVCCILLCEAYGQDDCANATLSWEMDPGEHCEITEFQVDIESNSSEYEYHFKVNVNYVDVSFLNICEQWSFTIIPISHGVIGFGRTYTEYIPLPPDADLSLKYFNATLMDDRDVILEWDLNNNTYGDCSLYYWMTVENEELEIKRNVYIEGYSLNLSTIGFMSPCFSYQLEFRTVNRAIPNIEGPKLQMEVDIPAKPQNPPIMEAVDIQATSFNMTWALQGDENRCSLINFYVDGGSYFNISVPLQDLLDPSIVSVEITSLRSNSMYYLQAYVENIAGISSATPMAVQTLDLSAN